MYPRSYRYIISLFTVALLLGTGNAQAGTAPKRQLTPGASAQTIRWDAGPRHGRLHLGRLHLGRLHLGRLHLG
jgi:hypothetical protein